MVILEIVLAHLLGDFVFQSNDLIAKKYKSWQGTLEHVCIIAAFTALFLFPYWQHKETWLAVGLIFLAHFVQDTLKVEYSVRYNQKKKSVLPFFLDQILHLALIFYVSSLFKVLAPMGLQSWAQDLYFSKHLVTYWIGLVLFSYTFDITLYQFARQKSNQPIEYKPNFNGMLKRLLLFSMAFVLYLLVNSSFV